MLNTTWVKSGLRLLVTALLLIPFGSIYLIVPSDSSVGIMMVFKTAVPSLLMFISLFAFSNTLFVKFKLVNDENSGQLPIDQREKHQ